MNNLLALPVVLPLLGSLLALVWPRRADWAGLGASVAAFVAAGHIGAEVMRNATLELAVGGWAPGLGLRCAPMDCRHPCY